MWYHKNGFSSDVITLCAIVAGLICANIAGLLNALGVMRFLNYQYNWGTAAFLIGGCILNICAIRLIMHARVRGVLALREVDTP